MTTPHQPPGERKAPRQAGEAQDALDHTIDSALSLYKDEPVPVDFASRVRAGLHEAGQGESGEVISPPQATSIRVLRGGASRTPSWMLAAAALVLGAGVMWAVLRASDHSLNDRSSNHASSNHASSNHQSAHGATSQDADAFEPLLAEVPVDLLPHVEFLASLDDHSFDAVMDGTWSPDGLLDDGGGSDEG